MSAFSVVTSSRDPRIDEYVALNDPVRRRQVERQGCYFIVEGIVAIERLLATPAWQVRSLLVLPKVAARLEDQLSDLDAPVLVADDRVLGEIVGFRLHRGALASVTRIAPPPMTDGGLAGLLERSRGADPGNRRPLLLVAEGVNDHENLGALYRNAAGFGVAAVVLDSTSADPFYRRSVRVSSGLVLSVPTLQADDVTEAFVTLRKAGVTVVALTPGGEVDLRHLDDILAPDAPVAVVVGAEGSGLSEAALRAADHRVAITMTDDVDSLNLSTAAAIALHHLR